MSKTSLVSEVESSMNASIDVEYFDFVPFLVSRRDIMESWSCISRYH